MSLLEVVVVVVSAILMFLKFRFGMMRSFIFSTAVTLFIIGLAVAEISLRHVSLCVLDIHRYAMHHMPATLLALSVTIEITFISQSSRIFHFHMWLIQSKNLQCATHQMSRSYSQKYCRNCFDGCSDPITGSLMIVDQASRARAALHP